MADYHLVVGRHIKDVSLQVPVMNELTRGSISAGPVGIPNRPCFIAGASSYIASVNSVIGGSGTIDRAWFRHRRPSNPVANLLVCYGGFGRSTPGSPESSNDGAVPRVPIKARNSDGPVEEIRPGDKRGSQFGVSYRPTVPSLPKKSRCSREVWLKGHTCSLRSLW